MMQQDWHSADIIAVLKSGNASGGTEKTHCGSAVNIARNHLVLKVL